MTLCQVAVIDKLPIHASQLIDGLLEVLVTDGILLQKGMALWIKETAIEGRHAERRAPFVNDAKERLQLRPERSRVWQKRLACGEVLLDAFLDTLQAIALAVALVLTYWQQFAGLGVEDEEQTIEDDERVVVNGLERVWLGLEVVRPEIQKALCHVAQRLVDLCFERIANAACVISATDADGINTEADGFNCLTSE